MKANTAYLRSKAGAFNCCLLFLLLASFICIIATTEISGTKAIFLVATIFGFLITTSLTAVKLFGVEEKLKLRWALIEFVYVILWTILFLIVSVLVMVIGAIPAGVFGLFTTFVYFAKIVFLYMTEVRQKITPPPYPTIK